MEEKKYDLNCQLFQQKWHQYTSNQIGPFVKVRQNEKILTNVTFDSFCNR